MDSLGSLDSLDGLEIAEPRAARRSLGQRITSPYHWGDKVLLLSIALLVVGTPIPVGKSLVFLSDAMVAVALLGQIAIVPRVWTQLSRFAQVAIVGLAAATLISLAAHPTAAGALTSARYLAIAGVGLSLTQSIRTRPTVVAAVLGGAAIVQSVIVLGQSLLGRRIGLGALEAPDPFVEMAPLTRAPTGTLHQPDLHGWLIASIAALLVVLALRKLISPWFAAAVLVLGSAANTVSFRRSFVLVWAGSALMLLVLALIRKRNQSQKIAAVLLLSILLGGFAALPHAYEGWNSRAQVTAGDPTTGRLELFPQMQSVLETSPVVGVGPGRYYATLKRLYPDLKKPTVVHVAPLLVLAEGGWLMGAAMGGGALAWGLAMWRRRRQLLKFTMLGELMILALPLGSVSLLTPLPTLYAIGPLLTALNLAALAAATASQTTERAT
jgi:hypothetical protein